MTGFRCSDVTTLGDLLDDRLPPERQAELAAHLEGCEACRRAFDELAAGANWWGALRRYAPPDGPAGETPESIGFGAAAARPGDAEDGLLDFLDPSTEPGHLGRFGPYEAVGLLGRGGMGVVLKAFDPALNRMVAIKVLAPQLATSATARQRFAREARAVAALAHDHIVAIHAVDSWNGLPYLVMQYVHGRSLQERISADGPLGVREVLRIGLQASQGMAAAHARGLIHRDIKPSNILLENGIERVKITDFGLARAADDASLTQSGYLAGTPQYMAPEQARGEPIDHRADLFSLGSVLYAACTGHSPFRAETTLAVLRRVCDDRPRPVRAVNPDVPEWLAAVIDRLLAKDPADRFASAAEVAERLAPLLAHAEDPARFPLPASARPAPAARRRRPWAAAALALMMISGGLGAAEATGITDVGALVATVLRIRTRDGTLVVEVEDPEVTVSVDNENGEITITGVGAHEVRLRPGRHQVHAKKDGRPVLEEPISITRGGRQVVRVRREPATGPGVPTDSGRVAGPPAAPATGLVPAARPSSIWAIDYAPDGRRIVAGESGGVRIWDADSRRQVAYASAPGMTVGWVAYSPDGRLIATAEHGRGGNLAVLRHAESAKAIRVLRGHTAGMNCVAFSPDGRELASSSWDGTIRLWDVATGAPKRVLRGHDGQITVVAYAPDGTMLASSSLDGTARLWDTLTWETVAVLRGHEKAVQRLAFAPDGKSLATAGFDQTIRLWDTASGRDLATLAGHEAPVVALAFSPDGKTIATAASRWGRKYNYAPRPSELRLWDVNTAETRAILTGHTSHVFSVRFSPDGKTLASGGMDTTLRFWDVGTGEPTGQIPPPSPPSSPDVGEGGRAEDGPGGPGGRPAN